MSNFSQLKAFATYLKNLNNLDNVSHSGEILPSFPDAELKEFITSIIDTTSSCILLELSKTYGLSNSSKTIQSELTYLSVIACTTQLFRAYDFTLGLNTKHPLSIDDALKIKATKLNPLHFPNLNDQTFRKVKSRSSTSAKTAGRERGLLIDHLLKSYAYSKQENEIQSFFRSNELSRQDHFNILYILLFKVIASIVVKLNLHKDEDLFQATSYWTNKYIWETRLPLPTRNVIEFTNEITTFSLRDYIDENKEKQFDTKYWRDSLFKRKKYLLHDNLSSKITGQIILPNLKTQEESLALLSTTQILLCLQLTRLKNVRWNKLSLKVLSLYIDNIENC